MGKQNKSNDLLSSNIPAFYVCILYAFGLFISIHIKFSINHLLLFCSCIFFLSILFNKFLLKNNISLFLLILLFISLGILKSNTLNNSPRLKREYIFYSSQSKSIPKNRIIEVTIESNHILFKDKMKGIIKVPQSIDTILTNKKYSIFLKQKILLEKDKHSYFINKNFTNYFLGDNIHLITSNKIENIINQHQIELKKKISEIFKDPTITSLVMGLLIGEKNDLSYDITSDFKKVGAMHILAVSGMHTALLFQVFSFLFIPIGNKKTNRIIRSFLLSIILIYFCLLSNNASSIVRATIMCIVICFGTIKNKSTNSLNTLGISGLLILYIQPNQLWDIGFQLSFVAVMGILYANHLYNQFNIPNKLKWISQTLLFTFCAQLFTLPILLFHFHTFSTYFLISNLILIPLSTCCIFLSLILLLIQSLINLPYSILEWTYLPFNWFIKISQHIAQWKYSWIEGIGISPLFLIIHLSLIILLVIYRNRVHQLLIICSLIVIQSCLEFYNYNNENNPQYIKINYSSHLITHKRQGTFISTKTPKPNYCDYIKSKYNLYKLNFKLIDPYKNYLVKYSKKTFELKATKYQKIKYIR